MTKTDTPGAKRTLEPDADTAVEQAVAEGAWPVRAWRSLRARASAASARAKQMLLAAATAAIDKGIASLQRLRQRTGDTQQPHEGRDDEHGREGDTRGRRGNDAREGDAREGDTRGRRGKPGTGAGPKGEPAAGESVAPKPRRRVRSLLVYLSVVLAGGMGGMALAYDLLAQLLDRRSAEVHRQGVKLSGNSKSMAELKQRLDQGQAKQTEAETRLAAALAENEKTLGELQQQRAEAQSRPANALTGRAGNPQRREDGGSSQGGAGNGQAAWTGAGDCNLGSGDIRSMLSGCIAEMNRR